jgi:hypothetical protein
LAYGKAFAYLYQNWDMKQYTLIGCCLLMIMMTLSSCEAIGDIFSAGFYLGIFVVIAVIALIIWLVSRFRR